MSIISNVALRKIAADFNVEDFKDPDPPLFTYPRESEKVPILSREELAEKGGAKHPTLTSKLETWGGIAPLLGTAALGAAIGLGTGAGPLGIRNRYNGRRALVGGLLGAGAPLLAASLLAAGTKTRTAKEQAAHDSSSILGQAAQNMLIPGRGVYNRLKAYGTASEPRWKQFKPYNGANMMLMTLSDEDSPISENSPYRKNLMRAYRAYKDVEFSPTVSEKIKTKLLHQVLAKAKEMADSDPKLAEIYNYEG